MLLHSQPPFPLPGEGKEEPLPSLSLIHRKEKKEKKQMDEVDMFLFFIFLSPISDGKKGGGKRTQ